MVEKQLLTPEEAGQALSIGRTKVYELVRAGEIESIKIGVSRRIPVEALRRYIDARLGRAGESPTRDGSPGGTAVA